MACLPRVTFESSFGLTVVTLTRDTGLTVVDTRGAAMVDRPVEGVVREAIDGRGAAVGLTGESGPLAVTGRAVDRATSCDFTTKTKQLITTRHNVIFILSSCKV